jgi:nucleoid DNA-binding protein
LEAVKRSLIGGNHIELRGFGTFNLRVRQARTGRNPKTGELIPVPERVVPTFKYTRKLKDEVCKLDPKDIK